MSALKMAMMLVDAMSGPDLGKLATHLMARATNVGEREAANTAAGVVLTQAAQAGSVPKEKAWARYVDRVDWTRDQLSGYAIVGDWVNAKVHQKMVAAKSFDMGKLLLTKGADGNVTLSQWQGRRFEMLALNDSVSSDHHFFELPPEIEKRVANPNMLGTFRALHHLMGPTTR